jgi:hypothetical protein
MASVRPQPFPQRAHVSAIALRLQRDQEETVLRWARWARAQVTEWSGTDDPGTWDPSPVLDGLAKQPS